jgi:hypothetical protein
MKSEGIWNEAVAYGFGLYWRRRLFSKNTSTLPTRKKKQIPLYSSKKVGLKVNLEKNMLKPVYRAT